MIKVEHENGYTGIVYGMSSISVFKDNKEVLHTGSLTKPITTEEELHKYLDEIPELLEELYAAMDDIGGDE